VHLWATRTLADQLVAGTVAARTKVIYYIFAQVFYLAVGYAASYGPFHGSWLYIYEGIVVAVITFAGAQRVASSYGRQIDGTFFEIAYLLSVPLTVKATAAAWLAIYGGYWLFNRALSQVSTESADSARAFSYWSGRLWEVWPFLVAAAIAVVFWSRLAHHVRYVATARVA